MGADERRHDPREAAELRVEYRRLNGFFAEWTRNLSKGGTFIRSDEPLEPGTDFVFELALAGVAEPLRLHGRVMWVIPRERASEDAPAGMGVRFAWSSDAERERVEAIVEGLMREQLGDRTSSALLGRAK